MQLKIVNSNSEGNAYILENEKEALLIECGVNFNKRVKPALNFNIAKVVGCLVTHEHLDHCGYVNQAIAAGINVWASRGTHEAMGTISSHRTRILHPMIKQSIGKFEVIPFTVQHDAAEPLGFLIRHEDCGVVLFLTDTYYSKYVFKQVNHMIVEANYDQEIIDKKLLEDKKFLRDRVLTSHLSIQTCLELLAANDLSTVRNIVLIHLSNSNSNAAEFKTKVERQTGKIVTIADPGVVVNLSKQPF